MRDGQKQVTRRRRDREQGKEGRRESASEHNAAEQGGAKRTTWEVVRKRDRNRQGADNKNERDGGREEGAELHPAWLQLRGASGRMHGLGGDAKAAAAQPKWQYLTVSHRRDEPSVQVHAVHTRSISSAAPSDSQVALA
jgi:hypothetical protein